MSKMQRLALVAVVLIGAFFVLRKTGVVPGPNPLKDARFASGIPVFPGAKFREQGGGNYYAEIGGPVTFRSSTWFFEISSPVAEVKAFYAANLPSGATPEDAADGEAGFTWLPPGAKEGEDVTIWIEEGELRISESVSAGS